jgi:hypothetical protein
MGTRFRSRWRGGRGVKLTTQLRVAPRLRMNELTVGLFYVYIKKQARNMHKSYNYMGQQGSFPRGLSTILTSAIAANRNEIRLFPVALRSNAGHDLFMLYVFRSHKMTHHSRYNSSGRVISWSQRPLPDDTQPSQQTNVLDPGGIRSVTLAGERPHTNAFDRAANWTVPYMIIK